MNIWIWWVFGGRQALPNSVHNSNGIAKNQNREAIADFAKSAIAIWFSKFWIRTFASTRTQTDSVRPKTDTKKFGSKTFESKTFFFPAVWGGSNWHCDTAVSQRTQIGWPEGEVPENGRPLRQNGKRKKRGKNWNSNILNRQWILVVKTAVRDDDENVA